MRTEKLLRFGWSEFEGRAGSLEVLAPLLVHHLLHFWRGKIRHPILKIRAIMQRPRQAPDLLRRQIGEQSLGDDERALRCAVEPRENLPPGFFVGQVRADSLQLALRLL